MILLPMHTALHSKDTPPLDDNICPVAHIHDNGNDDDLASDDKENDDDNDDITVAVA